MGKIWLIARREWGAYFSTWMGYIIMFIALLLDGLLFYAFALGDEPKYSSDVLRDFFYFSSGMAMVSALFLAMRLIAEERQTGTILLYYTSPVSERQMIYGKFLASLLMLLVLNILSAYLPAFILVEGKISWGHVLSGYLGLTLLGSSVLALSVFASSLAANQLMAGVMAAGLTVFFLILWLLSYRTDTPFREILAYASIHNERFNPFSTGVVHLKNVVYYLSFTLFFLEGAIKVLETRRLRG